MSFNDDESICIDEGLANPGEITSIVKGKYKYYHYNCDQFNDSGWGCGYRTTQTICSWIRIQKLESKCSDKPIAEVPTILEMQKILVDCGDKPSYFHGSKQWIGSFEASIIIDTLFDVPCKIVHCEAYKIKSYFDTISSHFDTFKSPLMMGGDLDNESKCILGVSTTSNNNNNNNSYFLIADPHCRLNKPSKQLLQTDKWITWENILTYNNGSFYNFCLPQLKAI